MFGQKSKPVNIIFAQEIIFRGAGFFHIESSAYLKTKSMELDFIPGIGMDISQFVGLDGFDESVFHSINHVKWSHQDKAYHAVSHPMHVSVGSLYELKIFLTDRIKYLTNSSPLNKRTMELLQRADKGDPNDRLFHHSTILWPSRNNINLVVYQNIRLKKTETESGEHHQFRKELWLPNVPQLGVEYTVEAQSTGNLITLSFDTIDNRWFAFSSPDHGGDYLQEGKTSFSFFYEDEKEKDEYLSNFVTNGWYSSKINIQEARRIAGNPQLSNLT